MTDVEVNRLIELGWWGNVIETCKRDGWLDNFGTQKEIGEFIFDKLIVYTNEQIESYVNYIIQGMQSELYQEILLKGANSHISESELEKKWEDYVEHMRIVPIKKDIDEGSSGEIIARLFRNKLNEYSGSEEHIVVPVEKLEQEIIKGIRNVVFVDDFSGTGNQLKIFMDSLIETEGSNKHVRDLPNLYPNIRFEAVVLVIHDRSLMLHSESEIEIKYVERIDNGIDFFRNSDDNKLFKGVNPEKRKTYIDYISKLTSEIIQGDEDYKKKEEYQLGIPIVFEHGCPNNSLMLLYAKSAKWKPLVELGDKR